MTSNLENTPKPTIEVTLSENNMDAFVSITPQDPQSSQVELEDIGEALKNRGVIFGINDDEIANIVNKFNTDHQEVKDALVAKGLEPVPGKDADFEYIFTIDISAKPEELADGSVDFKSLSLIQAVNEGDVLVKLIPPTQGEDGKNVLGEIAQAKPGQNKKLSKGPNTYVDEADANLLAGASGFVKQTGDIVEVEEGYSVNGDVDYSVGNIDYAKSVYIKNDVKSGFTITCGGDLEVCGVVEDATIESGGDVYVHGGFIGHHKGNIHAKGNCRIGFIRNQQVTCKGDITINNEAIQCELTSGGKIYGLGKSLTFSGGEFVALHEIRGNVFGNEQRVKTEVSVGVGFSEKKDLPETKQKIEMLEQKLAKINQALAKYEAIKRIKKELPPKEAFIQSQFAETAKKLESEISAFKGVSGELDQSIIEKAKIIINHTAHPGCVFRIGGEVFLIEKPLLGPKTLMLIGGKIKIL